MQLQDPEHQSVPRRPKIVVYTTDVVAQRMAGPGIRAVRFAQALSAVAEVRLIAHKTAELTNDDFLIAAADGDALLDHVRWADVLIMQTPIFTQMPEILEIDVIVVADLYDPFLLEQLQQGLYTESADQFESADWTVKGVNDMLLYSDYFICASEKQRDMWIGQLSSVGRLNPLTYRADPSLRNLIDVVPFGVDETAPVLTKSGIRGVVDGISETDKVLLWGGGIYDWFDPLTLIRAVAKVSETHDDLRLFFLATQHANSAHAPMKVVADSIQLAKELGAYNTTVFFNEAWVPHDQRANYFLDADIGVSTHLEHLETSFSFRTRLLDYIWAGLPIINSAGDAFEQAIVERHLGAIVAPGDVDQLAEAIEKLAYDPESAADVRRNVSEFGPELHWVHATEALVRFCAEPYRAADKRLVTERRRTAQKLVTMDSKQAARTQKQLVELSNRVYELEKSTSWRVTAPLRAVTRLLKRG